MRGRVRRAEHETMRRVEREPVRRVWRDMVFGGEPGWTILTRLVLGGFGTARDRP